MMDAPRLLVIGCMAFGVWCLAGAAIHLFLVVRHRNLTEQRSQARRRAFLYLIGLVAAGGVGSALAMVYDL